MECRHEFRNQADKDGVVRCHHCYEILTTDSCNKCGRMMTSDGKPIIHNDHGCNGCYSGGSAGTKHDSGKPDLGLFPREAIEAGSRAFMFGEKKYARDNWRRGISRERLVAATLRHLFAWKDGELSDPESNLSHLDHAQASLAMLITLHNKGDLHD